MCYRIVPGACVALFVLWCATADAQKRKAVNAGGQSVTIIQGQSVGLHAESSPGVLFQWIRNGLPINGANESNYRATSTGTYQVVTTNADDCQSDLSTPVTVNVETSSGLSDVSVAISASSGGGDVGERYTYTITIKNNGPDVATGISVQDGLPDGLTGVQLNDPSLGSAAYDSGQGQITWQIGQLAPGETATITFTAGTTKVGVIVQTATVGTASSDANAANNTATVSQTITGLIIPNVFTPNGDGVNDVFQIPGLEAYSTNDLVMMNRWGNNVYQKHNYQNDWDGSGLNEGTYFYLLKVQTAGGKWYSYKGYVTLLRRKVN